MSLTKQDKSLTVFKIHAQGARWNIGHNALKENLEQGNPTQDKLRSGVSVTLRTTRSSHICSHK